MNSSDYTDYKDYPKLTFKMRNDGIVHYRIKSGCTLTLTDIMEQYEYFASKYAGKQFLNVYEFEENADIDDNARKWASDPKGNNFTIADAFVIQSMAQKMIGNFYITFHKPVKPTKLFNDLESALKWLHSFEKKI